MTTVHLLLPDYINVEVRLPRVPIAGEVINHSGIWYGVEKVYFHTIDSSSRVILKKLAVQ